MWNSDRSQETYPFLFLWSRDEINSFMRRSLISSYCRCSFVCTVLIVVYTVLSSETQVIRNSLATFNHRQVVLVGSLAFSFTPESVQLPLLKITKKTTCHNLAWYRAWQASMLKHLNCIFSPRGFFLKDRRVEWEILVGVILANWDSIW